MTDRLFANQRREGLGVVDHVADHDAMLIGEQDQGNRITFPDVPGDAVDLVEGTLQARRGPVAVLHAERDIECDDHARPPFAGHCRQAILIGQ